MIAVLEQMAFDFDALTRDEYAGPAPLHFTVYPFARADLDAAVDEWIRANGNFGCKVGHPHLWFSNRYNVSIATPGHPMDVVSADLGCDQHYRIRCECVGGGHVYRAICGCSWWSTVTTEAGAVEEWHDHAWPGWRSLSPLPNDDASSYPPEWQTPGAPVITLRQLHATRHALTNTTTGGWNLSSSAVGIVLETPERIKP